MPVITVDGRSYRIIVSEGDERIQNIRVDGKPVRVEVLRDSSTHPVDLLVRTGPQVMRIQAEAVGETPDHYVVRLNDRVLEVGLERYEMKLDAVRNRGVEEGPAVVYAPMAGRIVSLKASLGMTAEEGQPLVVLEAMKMENEVASPKRGVVKEVYVQPGALVKAGDRLALVE